MRPGNPAALPRWVYLPATVGAVFVVLPLVALAVNVDWADFGALVSSPASRAALLLSLRTAGASTLLCLILGVPLALVLARQHGRVAGLLRPLILVPLVLPPVVGGIALLYVFGRLGLLGQYLEAAGIRVAFTTTAVVLAQTFVSLPQCRVLVFGIKTIVDPITILDPHPALAASLAATIRDMPDDMARYKSMAPFRDALLGYLDGVSS